MRIFIDHQIFAAQRWGGVSRYFAELAAALGRTEDVVIHAPIHLSDYLDSARVQVRGQRVRPFKGCTMVANTLGRLLRPKGHFDVHHATWYGHMPRLPGAKLVHTVHDLVAEMFPGDVRGGDKQARLKAHAIEHANLILCVSENTRSDLMNFYQVPKEKVRVTPLATSIGAIASAPFNVGVPYLLHVGMRKGYKNFDTLLDAFATSSALRKEYALVCFGGPPFDAQERKALAGLPHHGAGSVMHVTGDDDLLAGAYRGATLFVSPSKYEGFGLPLLEAMSSDCPVVAFRAASIPEVAGDAACYATEMTVDALRQAMEEILGNEKARTELIVAGRVQAARFSWAETARLTLESYSS